MRLLIDCSLLTAGGGIQVGLSVIRHAVTEPGLTVALVASYEVARQLTASQVGSLAQFVCAQRPGRKEKIQLIRSCSHLERRFRPDATFTVFGPAYWRSNAPRLQGFALPRLIYPQDVRKERLTLPPLATMGEAIKRHYLRRASNESWVVETEVVRDRLCSAYAIPRNKVHVIPNSYSADLTGPGGPWPADGMVFIPASYYAHKNLEIVPDVARALADRGTLKKFVLTLDRESAAGRRISQRAEKLGVQAAIQLVGQVPVGNLPSYYAKASVVLLPTLLECSTAVYPESFLTRVPLVTSDRDFARSLCGEAALYADPHDATEIAQQISRILEDDQVRNRLIQEGARALRDRYLTPSEKWSKQLELLENVARERRSRQLYVRSRTKWAGPLPPYARTDNYVEVDVRALCKVQPLVDLYFVRPRSWRLVLNYLRDIGLTNTLRKVVSRKAEELRNDKALSVGYGAIAENDGNLRPVGFVAPAHPPVLTCVSLPRQLVFPAEALQLAFEDRTIALAQEQNAAADGALAGIAGWHPESGIELDHGRAEEIRLAALRVLAQVDWSSAKRVKVPGNARPQTTGNARLSSGRLSASLFGYGNYAKTVIIPNCEPIVSFDVIHEIDPTQLAGVRGNRVLTTEPVLSSEDELSSAVFVASYHHSHAPLAVEALKRGKAVVVEKPLATSSGQLDALCTQIRRSNAPFFGCFQRRYSRFNAIARRDLSAAAGAPISYHCIVYEVPLPASHWYRWPSSRSRLLSNGCHWVDHFLFLNDFSEVVQYRAEWLGPRCIFCTLTLRNGAVFTMALTEEGSPRIGVQEHVELRHAEYAVRIYNSTDYVSEGPFGLIRKVRVDKMESYRNMYSTIARRLRDGMPGDSVESIEASASVALMVEDALGGSLSCGKLSAVSAALP
jgi:predicted dehydrogenase/glycosyltransferase involved in cell wall biosynthesis